MKPNQDLSPLGRNYYKLSKIFGVLSLVFKANKNSLAIGTRRQRTLDFSSLKSPGLLFFKNHYKKKYGDDGSNLEYVWKNDLTQDMRRRYEKLARSIKIESRFENIRKKSRKKE